MKRTSTCVRTWDERADPSVRTGVSLHSHTNHSKEVLDFIPDCASRIPIVSGFVRAEIERYEAGSGWKSDFSRAYWTPPVSSQMVFDAECAQIECDLGLRPLVSITDHDTIGAGLELNQKHPAATIPISVEWTVPFEGSHIHLGMHSLPPALACDLMGDFAAYTAQPDEATLAGLLARVNGIADALVVLNHPLWDHRRVGAAQHVASVERFLRRHRDRIDAVEINGLRPWQENQDVLTLADQCNVPAIAGGDRHGCQPNTVVNVTKADSWAEFVAEIRVDHRSAIWLLPEYWEPIGLRYLEGAADALRHYRTYPHGQRRFLDRVFVDIEDYGFHPLTFYWDGIPLWLTPVLATVRALGGRRLRPLVRWALSSPTSHSREAAVLTPATGSGGHARINLQPNAVAE